MGRVALLRCALAAAAAAGAAGAAAMWPMPGADAQASYRSTLPGPGATASTTPLWLQWTFSGAVTPGGSPPQFTAPTVDAAGVAYYGTNDGRLLAVDGATGVQLWAVQVAASGWVSAPAFNAGGDYFVAVAGAPTPVLLAFGRGSGGGAPAWSLRLNASAADGVATVRVAPDGTLLVWLPSSTLVVVDATLRAVTWTATGVASPPAVDAGATVVALANATGVAGVTLATGAPLWAYGGPYRSNAASSVFVTDGGLAFFMCTASTSFLVVNVTNGMAVEGGPLLLGTAGALLVTPSYFVVTLGAQLGAYRTGALDPTWSVNVPVAAGLNPVVDAANVVYVAGGTTVTALNGTTGGTLWAATMPLPVNVNALTVGAGGTLLTTSVGAYGVTALTTAPPPPPLQTPWPCAGGDAAHSGTTPLPGPAGPTVAPVWKVAVAAPAAAPFNASFVVTADGTTYFGTPAGDFVAVTAAGVARTLHVGVPMKGTPAVSADGRTVLLSTADGRLLSYATGNGQLVTTTNLGTTAGWSPVVDPGSATVYVGGHAQGVYGITQYGAQLWSSGLVAEPASAIAFSPAAGGTVAWAVDGGLLGYITLGHIGWGTYVSRNTSTSPTLDAAGNVYAGSGDGNLWALATSGSTPLLRWKFATGGAIASAPALTAAGVLYFGSNDGNVYAVNATTGAEAWRYATGGAVTSSPLVDGGGRVIVGSTDGTVYALAGATGALLWSYDMGAPVTTSPAIAPGGRIVIATATGTVVALADAAA